MTRPIGYYIHHHGNGHRQRALALAAKANGRLVLLGTGLTGRTCPYPCIDLPDDRRTDDHAFAGIDGISSRPKALHYAPLDHEGVRARTAIIAQWIARMRPALMVVDVSVEVAMLARLSSAKVVYVRLHGRRDDIAHLEAFRAASHLIAPFARQLECPNTPEDLRLKTTYCPGIIDRAQDRPKPVAGRILLVIGNGGDGGALVGELIAAIAAATPSHQWRVIGFKVPPNLSLPNLTVAGWVENSIEEIAAAEIVVGAAGDGLVNAVIALGKPFICCPEQRPFDEQFEKALALKRAGAAIVLENWEAPEQWPALLSQAMSLDRRRLAELGDPNGAANTMLILNRMADDQ